MDPNTGLLRNVGPLDREAIDLALEGRIVLTVRVSDCGVPPLSTEVNVTITVEVWPALWTVWVECPGAGGRWAPPAWLPFTPLAVLWWAGRLADGLPGHAALGCHSPSWPFGSSRVQRGWRQWED